MSKVSHGLAGFLLARDRAAREDESAFKEEATLQGLLERRQAVQQQSADRQEAIRQRGLDREQAGLDRQASRDIQAASLEERRMHNEATINARYAEIGRQAANDAQRAALEQRRLAEVAENNRRIDAVKRLIIETRPAPQQPIVQTDAGPVRVGPDNVATPITGPDGKPLPARKVERVLPGPLQKQLTEASEISDATAKFTSSFKDEYGGYKLNIVGEGVNKWKQTFGDDSGQARWWQDYELHQSQIRNKLFGSALTAPEIAAWNKSAINPGMDPKIIRDNLKTRAELETTGINRLMKGAAAGGYNKEQIEAFTGRSIAPSAPAAPKAPSVESLLEKYK